MKINNEVGASIGWVLRAAILRFVFVFVMRNHGYACPSLMVGKRSVFMIDQGLFDILACPQCKGDIKYNEKKTGLICEACKLEYPIRDDIPVMLIDEAKEIPG